MKTKKRAKSSRHRGSHTHGGGFKKKRRGSGHRGGIGMAGTGKRGDQKKTLITKKYGHDYFGKDLSVQDRKRKVLSVSAIVDKLDSFIKKGIAKDNKGIYEVELREYKIVGNSVPEVKIKIHAKAASKGAVESVRKSGGEIVIG